MEYLQIWILLAIIGTVHGKCIQTWFNVDCRGNEYVDIVPQHSQQMILVDDALMADELVYLLQTAPSQIVVFGHRYCRILCNASLGATTKYDCDCQVGVIF